MNNWLTCLVPSTDMNTALHLCHKVQHKPDLLRMEPAKENPWEVLQHGCTEAAPGHERKGKAQGSDLIDSPF